MHSKLDNGSDLTLIMDIGSGTQDILLYQPEKELENCFKLVLPSPTQNKAWEIQQVTRKQVPLFLTGRIMGGGPCVEAIKAHLKAGFPVYASEQAAKTIHDNLDKVKGLGIELTEQAPPEATIVVLEDIDIKQWQRFFELWPLKFPTRFAIAVQDHGESTEVSNRIIRMERWRAFMNSGGRLEDLVYQSAPEGLTRMKAIEDSLTDDLKDKLMLMDTGAAAICGALEDPVVASRENEGLVIVNMGNKHTLIAIVQKGRILGLCEHHTFKITTEKLDSLVSRLINGSLSHKEVFDDHGHGVAMAKDFSCLGLSDFVAVTGPRRELSASLNYYHAVPHGDMMLSGCFGPLKLGRQKGFIP